MWIILFWLLLLIVADMAFVYFLLTSGITFIAGTHWLCMSCNVIFLCICWRACYHGCYIKWSVPCLYVKTANEISGTYSTETLFIYVCIERLSASECILMDADRTLNAMFISEKFMR